MESANNRPPNSVESAIGTQQLQQIVAEISASRGIGFAPGLTQHLILVASRLDELPTDVQQIEGKEEDFLERYPDRAEAEAIIAALQNPYEEGLDHASLRRKFKRWFVADQQRELKGTFPERVLGNENAGLLDGAPSVRVFTISSKGYMEYADSPETSAFESREQTEIVLLRNFCVDFAARRQKPVLNASLTTLCELWKSMKSQVEQVLPRLERLKAQRFIRELTEKSLVPQWLRTLESYTQFIRNMSDLERQVRANLSNAVNVARRRGTAWKSHRSGGLVFPVNVKTYHATAACGGEFTATQLNGPFARKTFDWPADLEGLLIPTEVKSRVAEVLQSSRQMTDDILKGILELYIEAAGEKLLSISDNLPEERLQDLLNVKNDLNWVDSEVSRIYGGVEKRHRIAVSNILPVIQGVLGPGLKDIARSKKGRGQYDAMEVAINQFLSRSIGRDGSMFTEALDHLVYGLRGIRQYLTTEFADIHDRITKRIKVVLVPILQDVQKLNRQQREFFDNLLREMQQEIHVVRVTNPDVFPQ